MKIAWYRLKFKVTKYNTQHIWPLNIELLGAFCNNLETYDSEI